MVRYRDENFEFTTLDILPAMFTKTSERYRLDFSFICKIMNRPYPHLLDPVEIKLRLIINDLDFRTISLIIYPHKYPYGSAEIYLQKAYLEPFEDMRYTKFIDFYISGEYIYYMTSPGGHQIYRYNRRQNELTKIIGTYAEYFTYYEDYLYGKLDTDSDDIVRYNLNTNNPEFELVIDADQIGNTRSEVLIYIKILCTCHTVIVKVNFHPLI